MRLKPDTIRSWQIGPSGELSLYPNDEYGYEVGEFTDRRGVISLYRDRKFTMFDIVHDGRNYRWTYERRLGRNTLFRVAREMLEQFVGSPMTSHPSGSRG